MGGTQVTSRSQRLLGDDLQRCLPQMPSDTSISPEMEAGLFGTEQIPSQQPGSLPSLGAGGFEGPSHDSQLFRVLGGGHPLMPQTPLSPFLLAVVAKSPE